MDQDVRIILQHLVDLRGEIQQLRGETAQRFEETAQRFDRLETDIRQTNVLVEGFRGETAQRFGETAQRFEETAQRFDRVETDIRQTNVLVEDLRGQIRLVAEGVDNVNEKLDRFREEVGHEFEAVRTENRLLYGDLDTRVRNLEVAGG